MADATTTDLKRYDLVQVNSCYTTDHEMEASDDGEWVRYEFVTHLHAERDRLKAERDDNMREIYDMRRIVSEKLAERDALKAEAARLRAALEQIANMDRLDGEEGQPMHTAAAALASSGTVIDGPKNGPSVAQERRGAGT